MDAINVLKQACGIFVKEVIAGSLAEKDGEKIANWYCGMVYTLSYITGQLQVGDQLLEVNGMNLIGVSRDE